MPGCAKDIGIGVDDSVWIIGCRSGADGPIFKWNGSSWVADSANGFAKRISVLANGIPVTVHSNGTIYRRSSANVSSGSWNQLPGRAFDIGAQAYAWVIGEGTFGAGGRVHVWNEQSALGTNAPARAEWVPVNAGAAEVDVDRSGTAWLVDTNGTIHVATR